jgi:hypothetical protein
MIFPPVPPPARAVGLASRALGWPGQTPPVHQTGLGGSWMVVDRLLLRYSN